LPPVTASGCSFERSLFDRWFAARRGRLTELLLELVAIPTVSPDEEAAYPWLADRLGELGASVTTEQPPSLIGEHPSFTVTGLEAPLRPNLRAELGGPAGRPALLLNAHVDVVPAAGWASGFSPFLDGDEVVGRGSADTKNNIVMLLGALEFMRDCGLEPAVRLFADFVVEEEIGGNGSLAAVLNGCPADEVLVLEPTSLAVYHGHRGCLAFEVDARGEAAHMGSQGAGLSAIDGSLEVIGRLRELESTLAAEARRDPAYSWLARPTPVNVGFIHGGEWHGSFPDRCELRGNVGFPPGVELETVRRLLEAAVCAPEGPWTSDRLTVSYGGIHNEAYATDPRSPFVQRVSAAVSRQGGSASPSRGWNASCDARFFSRLLGLPTVVYGCGDLERAHSADERVSLGQLEIGMRTLCDLFTTERGDV
jgi:acetylornithine deacetylase